MRGGRLGGAGLTAALAVGLGKFSRQRCCRDHFIGRVEVGREGGKARRGSRWGKREHGEGRPGKPAGATVGLLHNIGVSSNPAPARPSGGRRAPVGKACGRDWRLPSPSPKRFPMRRACLFLSVQRGAGRRKEVIYVVFSFFLVFSDMSPVSGDGGRGWGWGGATRVDVLAEPHPTLR